MPRRLLVLAASALILVSCAGSNQAASINGVSISDEVLQQTVTDFAEIGEIQLTDGVAEADTVRSLLTSLIRAEATNQVIVANGENVSDDDRNEIVSQLDDEGIDGLPATLRELIIDLNAAVAALNRVKAPSPDVIADRYAKNPKSLGMLCVRHLVVEEEETARQAFDELGGSPSDDAFAAVAGKYSIEPNAKETGGALRGQSGDCIGINEWQAGFDPGFVAGALAARTGVPTAPVKSEFGWHVIYVRPFTAVSDSVSLNFVTAPGEFLLLGALADAKISVASRYGKWDPISGGVVAP